MFEKNHYAEIPKKLIIWFDAGKRDLPWRQEYTPYRVWISEIMLQQTQVKTMLPYYYRWMARFPDIRSVAEAPEEEILKHWEGLGYYSRARNIHKAAKIIVMDFAGDFPRDHRTVLSLPGIGAYTAGAIMSFAYNEAYPIVDANVGRVLARMLNIESPLGKGKTQKILWETARNLIPHGNARVFNQAIMELGALVCLPRTPVCALCPVRDSCKSFALGLVERRPVTGGKKGTTSIEVALGILVRRGKIFIQKRPGKGLMPHLWEFPGGKIQEGETPEEALAREFREELELEIRNIGRITTIRHGYTSFKVTLHAFFCEPLDESREPMLRAAVDSRWATPEELDKYAFPAANRKLIRMLMKRGETFGFPCRQDRMYTLHG